MSKSFNWWTRKLHRWGAIITAIPLLIVIVSGLLLQLKKEIAWIQPATMRGDSSELALSWQEILDAAKTAKSTDVSDWQDIDRLDVRPAKGLIKIRCKNGWELQLDSKSGEILSSAYRRSDLIESLHDGSFFSDAAKLWLFLPNGIVLLSLWLTGAWLWYMPFAARSKKRKQQKKPTGD